MKEIVAVCDDCKSTFIWSSGVSLDCPSCGESLVLTKFTKEMWEKLSPEEKEQVKADPYAYRNAAAQDRERKAMLKNIESIRRDLHFLYLLVLISLIISIICGVILILVSC